MHNNNTATQTEFFVSLNARGISFKSTANKGLFADFGLLFITDEALEEKCFAAAKNKTAVTFTEEEMAYILANKFNKK
jgi:hypothetical protein